MQERIIDNQSAALSIPIAEGDFALGLQKSRL